MTFLPADEGAGIFFRRTDLSTKDEIPATIEYVCDTSRSTTIGLNNVRIHTVEHVLAAVRAYEIDNLCIEVSGIEPPVGNGGSDIFVSMIEEAGVIEQSGVTPIVKLQKPVWWSEKDIHLVALPSDEYRISYTLNYPESPVLRSQYHSTVVNADIFKTDIAPCRTFSCYEEVSTLMDRGLIKGGSLDNAVIIKDDVVFSKNGLHFPNEMARHKILDLIGDFSLLGFHFTAHVMSIRSGHGTNFKMAQKLFQHITGA